MCCCGKPTINGALGYRWNDPNAAPSVYPVNPPDMQDDDALIFDEPGRCFDHTDSHSYHFRLVNRTGMVFLLVRHGGGDEGFKLSNSKLAVVAFAAMDSELRYALMCGIYHALSSAVKDARDGERVRWMQAAADKRIKVRRSKYRVEVRIEEKAAVAVKV